ncbi:hypothetical protein HWV62_9769 [Athelia sp. TMB]|nr:hypothetical protein HWV62_9769 [Athelia sp. TMB]
MRFSASRYLALAAIASPALAATYSRSANIVGSDFLTAFTFEAIADPTDGRVNYVDQSTAVADGLVSSTANTFKMGADSTTVLNASGAGRNSVRIKSVDSYTTHVAVFNVNHMPTGCGTWPAIWETDESDWPNGGEVDIVEGVNDVTPNQSTLHTSPGCTMPATVTQTGTTLSTDCNTADNGNSGCGVHSPDSNSFGPNFNAVGGGWYAMERNPNAISVWFWEAGSSSVPSDVSSGASSVDTDNWGTPTAYFPNTDCDIASHFDANNIIINLTFCGDWAGADSVYAASGCPSTCVDYVNNNPSAFTDAYFEFASINIYE